MPEQNELSKIFIGAEREYQRITLWTDISKSEADYQKAEPPNLLEALSALYKARKTAISEEYQLIRTLTEVVLAYYSHAAQQTKVPAVSKKFAFDWTSLSTVQKIRLYPREFLSYATFLTSCLTLFGLLSGLLLGRLVIAPDIGVATLILSLIFWLMTQLSKRTGGKSNV